MGEERQQHLPCYGLSTRQHCDRCGTPGGMECFFTKRRISPHKETIIFYAWLYLESLAAAKKQCGLDG